MSLIGIVPTLTTPCDDAGGAAPLRTNSLDAYVPTWAGQIWKEGSLVKTQTAPGQPWVIWLATSGHKATDPSPTVNPAGWVAVSTNPTQIPSWTTGTAYQGSSPVRISDGHGGFHLYVASKIIGNSTNPPDTAAGKTDGWVEVTVPSTPPAPKFDPLVNYRDGDMVQSGGILWYARNAIAKSTRIPGSNNASPSWVKVHRPPVVTTAWSVIPGAGSPSATNPPNPVEGDRFINTLYNVAWTYGDDPQIPGTNLKWQRDSQCMFHTNGPVTLAGAAGSRTATFTGATTEPNPLTVIPEDGDLIFEHAPITNLLLKVHYL